MLNRHHRKLIEEALDSQAGVVLLGPGQVGTTTLAQDIAEGAWIVDWLADYAVLRAQVRACG